jgi:hypothetical protein
MTLPPNRVEAMQFLTIEHLLRLTLSAGRRLNPATELMIADLRAVAGDNRPRRATVSRAWRRLGEPGRSTD